LSRQDGGSILSPHPPAAVRRGRPGQNGVWPGSLFSERVPGFSIILRDGVSSWPPSLSHVVLPGQSPETAVGSAQSEVQG